MAIGVLPPVVEASHGIPVNYRKVAKSKNRWTWKALKSATFWFRFDLEAFISIASFSVTTNTGLSVVFFATQKRLCCSLVSTFLSVLQPPVAC